MSEAPRALVINLATATERLEFIARQCDLLGLAWDRLEAVTPDTLNPSPADPLWQRWERPLRATEMAGLSSHLRAWRRVAEGAEPVLILEDDALLALETASQLARWARLSGIDHLSLETRGRKKSLGPSQDGLARLYQDRSGAAAYLLWPRGAERLIVRASAAPGLADGIICAAYDIRSYQADPALALQLDQCAAHGIAPPLATRSQIDAERKPLPAASGDGAGYRLRRLRAQLRMAGRHLQTLGRASRREVAPSVGIAQMAQRVAKERSTATSET